MKKIHFILVVLCCVSFFSSCLSTLYPFFTEEDVTFEPSLIGEWTYKTPKENGFIYFEHIPQNRLQQLAPGIRKLADKGYLISRKTGVGSEPASLNFAFLAKIGNNYYLDYYPAEMDFERKVDNVFKAHYTKMHRCYKITIRNQGSFNMDLLEGSFLDELIDKKKIHIRYEEINILGKKRIITASTKELQQYVLKYGNDPKAYNTDNSYSCERTTITKNSKK